MNWTPTRLLDRLITLRGLWLLCIPLGVFIRLNLSSIAPNDVWWHVKTGLITLQTGAIPTVDLFTFTQTGQPWINQAWLMQVWMALLNEWGGAPLIIFAHAIMITAGYSAVSWFVARRDGVRIGALATLVGVATGLQNWAVRPQTVSFLFMGLLIVLIERHRGGKTQALWWTIPIFAIWSNAHGAFVFGLALLGLYVVGTLWDAWRDGSWRERRGGLLVLCVQGLLALAALALNPQGIPGMIAYILGFFQSKATVEFNMEFTPLTVRMPDGILFIVTTLWFILVRVRSGKALTAAQTLTLLAFGLMALWSRRSVPWYGMVLIPIAAEQMRAWWSAPRPIPTGTRTLNALILGLLLIAAILASPWLRAQFPALAARYPLLGSTNPVEATQVLCAQMPPGTHGYHALAYASYLTYACPDLPTFLDTRFELFPVDLWDEYLGVMRARYDWEEILQKHEITYLFIRLDEQELLVRAADESPAWEALYRDEHAAIFIQTAAR